MCFALLVPESKPRVHCNLWSETTYPRSSWQRGGIEVSVLINSLCIGLNYTRATRCRKAIAVVVVVYETSLDPLFPEPVLELFVL